MRARTIMIGLLALVILAILAIVLIPRFLQPERVATPMYWPTQGWRTSTPEEQGLDSAKLAEGLKSIQDQNIAIDSLLIIRNGTLLMDTTFYPYDGELLHNMASVTKSVMTTLIGIAADQGKLQLDQPMLSFFPERTIANLDARKEKITVRHLAGMVNGFESGCLVGDLPTIERMQAAPDWVQAALDRKMVLEPGTEFCYDSPGMHLLSAILQKATGMTALDFARKNLFEPLGIRDVIWESDPQGITHGWGDLHLKPREAAKLGYLWLNKGVWHGKQIVSAGWVEEAVKPHSKAGGDGYGYGWWVSEDGYSASGRGGQHIKVAPALNAIVVTTGGGFEYDDISPYLIAAVVDPSKPLPANPAGVAELNATIATLPQAPAPYPIAALPETAREVSGKTYLFAANALDLASVGLEFDDSSQAILHLKLKDWDKIHDWPIGLDGKYRQSPDGEGLRGYWSDPQTFVFEIFDIGQITYHAYFEDDRLVIDAPELGIKTEGQRENP
jgi:CubicO group peptidase (beta-lactamase class C family)